MTTVLAFDTSGPYCAAALIDEQKVLATGAQQMSRGQAEHLMPLLQDVLDRAGLNWQQLDRIGVGVGPGNFTGIRISVSAARGLSLGLGIPAIGVTSFQALHHNAPPGLALVSAPRAMVYAAYAGQTPVEMTEEEALSLPTPLLRADDPAVLVQAMAQVVQMANPAEHDAPVPFYLRPADAAPSRDQPPVILDDA